MKLFGHYVYLPIMLLAGSEFAVAALALLAAGNVLEFFSGAPAATDQWWPSVIFSAAVTTGLTAVGLYQAKQRLRIEGVIARIAVGLGLAAILLALIDFFYSLGIGGAVGATALGMSLIAIGLARAVLWRWVDHEAFQRRILVYGAGTRAAALLRLRRQSDRRGFVIAAFIVGEGDDAALQDPRVRRLEGSLLDFVRAERIDEIVVAIDDRRRGFPVRELLDCKFAGIAVVDLLAFLERETGKIRVDLVNPSWLIYSEGSSGRLRLALVSRALDVVCAGLLLVVGLPFMLIVAIAIWIDDGRPVLYRQERVGLNGRPFTLYKFRSMSKNAEADGKAQWAGVGDSRVTRVGRIARKLRLDELPQLFNVLGGSMSIVGPRPERPEFVDQLSQRIPYYQERHSVKPGITGWAQLSYPYGSSEKDAIEKLEYDLYYIKYKSLIFDLMVLLQTAEVVLWGKGAR